MKIFVQNFHICCFRRLLSLCHSVLRFFDQFYVKALHKRFAEEKEIIFFPLLFFSSFCVFLTLSPFFAPSQ